MPANIKYLSSAVERALKISAAIVGGYLVSASFHLMVGTVPFSREIIVVLSGVSFFLVWGGLMILAFLAHKGWKIWCIYLALTLAFGAITWFLK
jgi:hypothetical protein